MSKAWCLSCDGEMDLGPKPKVSQLYTCQRCKSEFELVWLNPIELDSIDPTDYLFEDYYEDNIYK